MDEEAPTGAQPPIALGVTGLEAPTEQEFDSLGGRANVKPSTALHTDNQGLAFRLLNYFVELKRIDKKTASTYRSKWKRKFAPHLLVKRYNNVASATAANTSLPPDDEDDLFDEAAHARKQRQAIERLQKEKQDLEQTIQRDLERIQKSQQRIDVINHKLQKWSPFVVVQQEDEEDVPPPLEENNYETI